MHTVLMSLYILVDCLIILSSSVDLTSLVKAYTSGREPDYVTSVLDCATGVPYRAMDMVLKVLVEGLGRRATLLAVKPCVEQCVS